MSDLDDEQVPVSMHSSATKKRSTSMDDEFHNEELHDGSLSSSTFSSDAESEFGEASDNSEPDKEFMSMMLQESHPDRLNLLEMGLEEPEIPPNQTGTSSDNADDAGSSSSSIDFKASKSTQPMNPAPRIGPGALSRAGPGALTRTPAKEALNGDSSDKDTDDDDDGSKERPVAPATETPETGEEADTFLSSPTTTKRPQIDRQSMLGAMGKSTKKSFRKISGGFWAKPFKGLKKGKRKGNLEVDSSEEIKS
jgi:hypothetical protein